MLQHIRYVVVSGSHITKQELVRAVSFLMLLFECTNTKEHFIKRFVCCNDLCNCLNYTLALK